MKSIWIIQFSDGTFHGGATIKAAKPYMTGGNAKAVITGNARCWSRLDPKVKEMVATFVVEE